MKQIVDYKTVYDKKMITLTWKDDLTYDKIDELQLSFDKIITEDFRVLVVDISDVDFLDSSGAGVLMKLQKDIRRKNRILILQGIRPRPRRVLKFLRLDRDILFSANEENSLHLIERILSSMKK